MSLREILSCYWFAFQGELFPALDDQLGPLGERYESFIRVLEFARVERMLPYFHGLPGRPQEDRAALARAFIAKAVFDITTTRGTDRAACARPDAAALVRLDPCWGDSQRGNVLACFCRVR